MQGYGPGLHWIFVAMQGHSPRLHWIFVAMQGHDPRLHWILVAIQGHGPRLHWILEAMQGHVPRLHWILVNPISVRREKLSESADLAVIQCYAHSSLLVLIITSSRDCTRPPTKLVRTVMS